MNRFLRLTVCLSAALLLSTATAKRVLGWEHVWGPTQHVVIDDANNVYALGPSKMVGAAKSNSAYPPVDIHRWENKPMAWTPLGKFGKAYATAGWTPKTDLFCLTDDGTVFRHLGKPLAWESIGSPPGGAAQMCGGPDGLFATAKGASPDVYRWEGKPNDWKKVGGPAKSLAVGKSSDPEFKLSVFALSADSAGAATKGVYRYSGGWTKVGGQAGAIVVSGTQLFATNPASGDILSPIPNWKRIGGPGKMFAADNRGNLYGLVVNGQAVYRWTKTPNAWEKIGGPAGKIFAGGDGLLFATHPQTGELFRYSGSAGSPGGVPNFAGAIVSQKLKPLSGTRNVLAILWDPQRPQHPAPPKADVEKVLFGPGKSVAGWFQENSGGKVVIKRAGVLGWYKADKPGNHYWDEVKSKDSQDKDGDGWLNGHVEKWAEAIRKAAKEFNFAAYDANGDKVITPDELAVLVVIPQNNVFGTVRGTAGREYPNVEPLVVQGVKVPLVSEWYSGNPVNYGAPAHELCHQLFDAPDMYAPHPHRPGAYSLMDVSYRLVHLDPFEKLKLGFVSYKAVAQSSVHNLVDVETGRQILILYRPNRGPNEYFIVENRWRGGSYDAGFAGSGGIPADGLAVWHISEDPKVFNKTATTMQGEWGRLGVRLVRANGGNPVNDSQALLSVKGSVLSDVSSPANLRWLDGSPSGLAIKLLSDPGKNVMVSVTVKP